MSPCRRRRRDTFRRARAPDPSPGSSSGRPRGCARWSTPICCRVNAPRRMRSCSPPGSAPPSASAMRPPCAPRAPSRSSPSAWPTSAAWCSRRARTRSRTRSAPRPRRSEEHGRSRCGSSRGRCCSARSSAWCSPCCGAWTPRISPGTWPRRRVRCSAGCWRASCSPRSSARSRRAAGTGRCWTGPSPVPVSWGAGCRCAGRCRASPRGRWSSDPWARRSCSARESSRSSPAPRCCCSRSCCAPRSSRPSRPRRC